jgi:hypothetical protein
MAYTSPQDNIIINKFHTEIILNLFIVSVNDDILTFFRKKSQELKSSKVVNHSKNLDAK